MWEKYVGECGRSGRVNDVAGLDKSFSNEVAHRASIDPYLVARPKKWLPKTFDR